MDYKSIKMLAKILNESGLSAVEVSEGDKKIRLEKNISFSAPPYSANTAALAVKEDSAIKLSGQNEPKIAIENDNSVNFNNIVEIKAPMIGVFYAAASPTDKPFVEIGSKVKRGDTLCIIEAMKVMNEIAAERDGEIVDICVQNGQVVEYSQVLFKIF